MPPGEVVDELRRALQPAGLDEATLPRVLTLPEVHQRPELAVPLLRLVADLRASIPDESLVTAACLAMEAGAVDQVRHHLLQPLTEIARRALSCPWMRSQAPELFVRLNPSKLLSMLRQTRETYHGRDWLEDCDPDRLELAAAAFEALHRPRQARKLWLRLASSSEVNAGEDQRERARAALE